jgi:hypothetical protein
VAAGAPVPAAVGDHLATCVACREELDTLRRALALADAELADLAAAEPSAALAARIRQSVSVSRPSPAWHLGWLWPAVPAAAVILGLSVVWWAGGTTPTPPRRTVTSPATLLDPTTQGAAGAASTTVVSGAADAAPAPGGSSSARAPSSRPLGTVRAGQVAPPEVLVPAGEEEALLRFVALVHRERLAPSALAASGQASPAMAELVPLDIPPLEIVPLDAAEGSGT